MLLADYHMHSGFSADSDASMESMVLQAIQLQLHEICFTEHMDYDYPKQYHLDFTFSVEEYFEATQKLKEKYQNQIKIRTGIELGVKPNLAEQLNHLVTSYPFDFVIASSHLVNNLDPYYNEFWKQYDIEGGLRLYFQSIIDNIHAFSNFDVYGHIDYIVRYIPDKHYTFSYDKFAPLLDEVLKTIINAKKGIEVNTAGYKYGLGHTNPHETILQRYFALGGSYITIGSDAHKPEHIAYDFTQANEMLHSLGIHEYSIFEKRQQKKILF